MPIVFILIIRWTARWEKPIIGKVNPPLALRVSSTVSRVCQSMTATAQDRKKVQLWRPICFVKDINNDPRGAVESENSQFPGWCRLVVAGSCLTEAVSVSRRKWQKIEPPLDCWPAPKFDRYKQFAPGEYYVSEFSTGSKYALNELRRILGHAKTRVCARSSLFTKSYPFWQTICRAFVTKT
jgi:hypothetical protein